MNPLTKSTATPISEETMQKRPSLREPRDAGENVLLTLFQEASAEQVRRAAQEQVRFPRPFTHD
jgi:bifunctional DNase/RNase